MHGGGSCGTTSPSSLFQCDLFELEAKVLRQDDSLIVFEGGIGSQRARLLLDSGARGMFISEALASRIRLKTANLAQPLSLRMANGERSTATQICPRVPVVMGAYRKRWDLTVVKGLSYDVILGMPFLTAHSPNTIDWRLKSMVFQQRGQEVRLVGEGPGAR